MAADKNENKTHTHTSEAMKYFVWFRYRDQFAKSDRIFIIIIGFGSLSLSLPHILHQLIDRKKYNKYSHSDLCVIVT